MVVKYLTIKTKPFKINGLGIKAILADMGYYSKNKGSVPLSEETEVALQEIRRQLRDYIMEIPMCKPKGACVIKLPIRQDKIGELWAVFGGYRMAASVSRRQAEETEKEGTKVDYSEWLAVDEAYRRGIRRMIRDAAICEAFYTHMLDAIIKAAPELAKYM